MREWVKNGQTYRPDRKNSAWKIYSFLWLEGLLVPGNCDNECSDLQGLKIYQRSHSLLLVFQALLVLMLFFWPLLVVIGHTKSRPMIESRLIHLLIFWLLKPSRFRPNFSAGSFGPQWLVCSQSGLLYLKQSAPCLINIKQWYSGAGLGFWLILICWILIYIEFWLNPMKPPEREWKTQWTVLWDQQLQWSHLLPCPGRKICRYYILSFYQWSLRQPWQGLSFKKQVFKIPNSHLGVLQSEEELIIAPSWKCQNLWLRWRWWWCCLSWEWW